MWWDSGFVIVIIIEARLDFLENKGDLIHAPPRVCPSKTINEM